MNEPKDGASSAFVPRNLQIKATQDGTDQPKAIEGPTAENEENTTTSTAGEMKEVAKKKANTVAKRLKEALKKKPKKARTPSPPLPSKKKLVDVSGSSDDEDDLLNQAPIQKKAKMGDGKKIVFGSLKTSNTIQNAEEESDMARTGGHSKKQAAHGKSSGFGKMGEEGELQSSEDEGGGDTDAEFMNDLLNDTDGEIEDSDKEENKDEEKSKTKEKKLKKKKAKKEKKVKVKKEKRSRSRSRERKKDSRDRDRDRDRRRSRSRRDDDDYHRRRSSRRSTSRDRRRGGYRSRRDKDTTTGEWAWSRGAMERQKERDKRDRSRSPTSRYRRSSRSRRRSSSGSRSEQDKMLDSKQLFEIARKNASAMLQAGTLQQIRNMSAEEIATLRSGGKSVDELVEYCKKLQRRADRAQKKKEGIEPSSESEQSEEGESFINHPFVVNQAKIIMNIPNATPLPAKTAAQRAHEEATLRLSFPVSSGEVHRTKEPEWTPVVPEAALAITQAKEQKAVTAPKIPKIQLPSGNQGGVLPLPAAPSDSSTIPGGGSVNPAGQALEIAAAAAEKQMESDNVFDNPPSPPSGSIGDIVSKRLEAVKRLQSNPNDVEAMKLMQIAEDNMKKWAASKNLPGQFTGTTGARVLTQHDLQSTRGPQAWATRDQLRNVKALDSGVGMYLLQKMGWRPGEGLGRHKAGPIEPLTLDVKSDKKGLISLDEMPSSRKNPTGSFTRDLQGKHPVSALLELCNKRRWGPPSYTCVEQGSANHRKFLWKVHVNGVEYQPAMPSSIKKEAKAQAAQVVLQSLGLVPRNAKLPIVIA